MLANARRVLSKTRGIGECRQCASHVEDLLPKKPRQVVHSLRVDFGESTLRNVHVEPNLRQQI